MPPYTTLVDPFFPYITSVTSLNIAIKITCPDENNWKEVCLQYAYEYKTVHSNIVPNFHLSGPASSYRGGRGSSR